MSKENNDLFNFPIKSRGQQERVSFEGGGKVESKREWQTNPESHSMEEKPQKEYFKGKEVKRSGKKMKSQKEYFMGREVKPHSMEIKPKKKRSSAYKAGGKVEHKKRKEALTKIASNTSSATKAGIKQGDWKDRRNIEYLKGKPNAPKIMRSSTIKKGKVNYPNRKRKKK